MDFMKVFKHGVNFAKSYILSNDERFVAFINYACQFRDIDEAVKLFLDKKIQNKLKILNIQFPINSLPISILNSMLNDNYFKNRFLDLKIEYINGLVLKGLIIPFSYIKDNVFINKYLEVIGV